MKDLPASIILLHLAQLHLNQSSRLIPLLSIRPNHQFDSIGKLHYKKQNQQTTQSNSKIHSTYYHHINLAIYCLRSILSLTITNQNQNQINSDSISIELNLITRCKLIQILLSETHHHQEALQLIQHGLQLSSQRDHLTQFKLILNKFLIQFHASNPNVSFRQIKKQIQLAVQISIKNNSIDQNYISWYYHFQLLICNISYQRAKDFPTTLATLKTILTLSEIRKDWELYIACKTFHIKLAMDRSDWKLVSELFNSLIPMIDFNLESQSSSFPTIPHQIQNLSINHHLKNFIMLLLIIFYSIIGQTQSAKVWLKHLRTELDSPKFESGQELGFCKIHLKSYSAQTHQRQMVQFLALKSQNNNSSVPTHVLDEDSTSNSIESQSNSNLNSQYVIISIMPKEIMYTLTYLVSLAVYFDGHGNSPKSLIYAKEGLKQIDRQLTLGFHNTSHHQNHDINNQFLQPWNNSNGYYPSMIPSIKSWIKTLLAMKLETNILITQLAIVRSDFLHADQLLVEIIRRVSDSENWEFYNARISFLKSILSHATGNLTFARQSLLTTLHLVQKQTKNSNQLNRLGYSNELSTLSKACYFLVRMAESQLQHPSTSTQGSNMNSSTDLPKSLALDHVVKELSCASELSTPNIDMAIQIVLAMSCGEIVKAKHHLTTALNQANKMSNTHLKMILLGLLSTLFLNTRSDQATAMLKSCFKLSLGFSSTSFSYSTTHINQHSAKNQVAGCRPNDANDIVVGNPSLGLWVGKKLLDVYTTELSAANNEEEKKLIQIKIEKLHLSIQAHENFLNRIPLL